MVRGEGQLVTTIAALYQLFCSDQPAGMTTEEDFPVVG